MVFIVGSPRHGCGRRTVGQIGSRRTAMVHRLHGGCAGASKVGLIAVNRGELIDEEQIRA
jgi:hypothetical protein